MSVKKIAKVVSVVVGVVFVLIQFIQPNRTNPEVDESKTMQTELNIPADINALLVRGCKDCHSNQTVWPFYSYIAPASWLVSNDVTEGRKRFNMSEWANTNSVKKFRNFPEYIRMLPIVQCRFQNIFHCIRKQI